MEDTNNDLVDAFFAGEMPTSTMSWDDYRVFKPKLKKTNEKKINPRSNGGLEYVQKFQRDLEIDATNTLSSFNITGITAENTGTVVDSTFATDSEAFNLTSTTVDSVFTDHRQHLPIYKFKREILQQVRSHPVVIVRGLTGCGKTTQVPQYIYDDCNSRREFCNILISQPRKIAAITVAQRVCQERHLTLGTTVGYQVGLDKKFNVDDEFTHITFCTTGVILQKLISEKSMSKYSHIILDEVHERDIEIDFLILLVRRFLVINSPRTKLILMSATLDSKKFQEFFKIPLNESGEREYIYPPIIDLNSAKRKFPIDEYFLDDISIFENFPDLIDYRGEPNITNQMYYAAAKLITLLLKKTKRMVDQKTLRNVLVFLPGLREIERFQEELNSDALKDTLRHYNPEILILHSTLSTEEQRAVFCANDKIKIILSTNIAESSVTLPNVVYVIDFCLTKSLVSSRNMQMSTLVTSWVTKNNCKQRAGRTGRVMPGAVYRLIHQDFYRSLPEQAMPEMLLIPLESVIIKIKKLGMGTPLEILALSLDPPDESKIVDAVLTLKEYGGLYRFNKYGKFEYDDGDLSYLGEIMSAMPCDIRITRLMVLGYLFSVLDEAIVIAAGLNIKGIFMNSLAEKMKSYVSKVKWSKGSASDCIAILNAYNTWIELHNNGYFCSRENEREWCRNHGLDLKNLNEMRLLIDEFKWRLEKLKIAPLHNRHQSMWLPQEKIFVLKVIMAGAFGISNFFMIDYSEYMERNVYKSSNITELTRSVYFRGFDKNTVGEIYRERIKEILVQKGVCSSQTIVNIFFDYGDSGRVYVTFEEETNAEGNLMRNDFSFCLGSVLPEVYKAIKLRQLERNIQVPVMDREASLDYAMKRGIGENGGNRCLIMSPKYWPLPTRTTGTMRGIVTHVEDCRRFFFRPLVGYGRTDSERDERYKESYEVLRNRLLCVKLTPIRRKMICYGTFCVYVDEMSSHYDHYERAKIVKQCSNGKVKILLIDHGAMIEVGASLLFEIGDSEAEIKIMRHPRRVFECRLKEVQPSSFCSFAGNWSGEAIEMFRTNVLYRESTIEIYAVVNGVVTVDLKTSNSEGGVIHWNAQLIAHGFAEECDESFLVKSNHMLRRSNFYSPEEMVDPEKEFDDVVDTELFDRFIPSPPLSKCKKRMVLVGPISPLETNIHGISSVVGSHVTIDSNSVNQILLDEDFYKSHSKFYVAGDLTCSSNSNVRIRETTKMPNITGLATTLALIFAPYAELRRDTDKNRFVSVLTGLGYDEENSRPFFRERDASLLVDFSLEMDDVFKINSLRSLMSEMLHTTPFESFPNITDPQRAQMLTKIKETFISIVNKKNVAATKIYPDYSFTWGIDQSDAKKLVTQLQNRAVFDYIAVPPITPMTEEKREQLLSEVDKFERGITFNNRCPLCDCELSRDNDLRLHIMTKMHINNKRALLKEEVQ